MSTISLEDTRIKELFKQAILEALDERKDLFSDLFAEVLEDFAMIEAIKVGEESESVSRDEVFQMLEAEG